jgi:hypothetical protein
MCACKAKQAQCHNAPRCKPFHDGCFTKRPSERTSEFLRLFASCAHLDRVGLFPPPSVDSTSSARRVARLLKANERVKCGSRAFRIGSGLDPLLCVNPTFPEGKPYNPSLRFFLERCPRKAHLGQSRHASRVDGWCSLAAWALHKNPIGS